MRFRADEDAEQQRLDARLYVLSVDPLVDLAVPRARLTLPSSALSRRSEREGIEELLHIIADLSEETGADVARACLFLLRQPIDQLEEVDLDFYRTNWDGPLESVEQVASTGFQVLGSSTGDRAGR